MSEQNETFYDEEQASVFYIHFIDSDSLKFYTVVWSCWTIKPEIAYATHNTTEALNGW